MFNVGDAVYHPVNGAGIVARVQRTPAPLGGQRCYRIRLVTPTKTTMLVPIGRAKELGLRPAASAVRVAEILQVLSSEPAELLGKPPQRYAACQAKLETADSMLTAEVVRDLSWHCTQRSTLDESARRLYKKALALLGSELAVAQGIPLPEADAQITEALAQRAVSA